MARNVGVKFEYMEPGRLVDGELRLELLTFDSGDSETNELPLYIFDMNYSDSEASMGQIGLRIGYSEDVEKYQGNIGYHVDPPYQGNRYAARSVRLLLPFAKRHGLDWVWITCNPDNGASRRTCEIVGAELVDIVEIPTGHRYYQQGERRKCRYLLKDF